MTNPKFTISGMSIVKGNMIKSVFSVTFNNAIKISGFKVCKKQSDKSYYLLFPMEKYSNKEGHYKTRKIIEISSALRDKILLEAIDYYEFFTGQIVLK
jgi:hypothetical protein